METTADRDSVARGDRAEPAVTEFYGPERAAVLVIRIWRTDTGFTARVIRVRDLPDGEEAGEATADRDRLYAIVHQWLAELLGE